MKVVVSAEACQGHNRCAEICPEVFAIDRLGFAVARSGEVLPELTPRVLKAVENCPERAISIIESAAEAAEGRGAQNV